MIFDDEDFAYDRARQYELDDRLGLAAQAQGRELRDDESLDTCGGDHE
jgi:hypothetical protein